MKRLLLIEDNFEMRENTQEILELAGFEVYAAENGKIGVTMAQEHLPDIIICDVMMPELDGYGVLRMLSRNPKTAYIPFIFLTAKAEKSDFRKGMQLGADDYITKPFDDVDLLDAIEMRLQKSAILKTEFDRDKDGLAGFINEARGMEALQELSAQQESRYYKAKDLIYAEGGFPRGLFFIQKGKVKTCKTNEDAKEYIIDLHKTGDFVGYKALLTDNKYSEAAIALEDTELMVIPKDDFFALLYNNRDVSNKFIKMLSNNLEEKEEQLLHLAYDTVRKRVADALLLLQERYKNPDDKNFSMPISRENLSNIVGSSKECVIRVLSEFKEDQIIQTHMSEITIIDSGKLEEVRY